MKKHFLTSQLPYGTWPWWLSIVGYVLSILTISIVPSLLQGTFLSQYGQVLGYGAAALLAVGLISLIRRRNEFGWFNLGTKNWPSVIGWGVLAGVAHIVIVAVLQFLIPSIRSNTVGDLISMGFGREYATPLAMLISITVLAPVFEELFFRGLIFRSLRDGLAHVKFFSKTIGKRHAGMVATILAVAVSALAFISIHSTNETTAGYLALYAVMPVVTALVYLKTGSLASAIVAHAVNNGFVVFMALLKFPSNMTLPLEFYALPLLGTVICCVLCWLMARLLGEK